MITKNDIYGRFNTSMPTPLSMTKSGILAYIRMPIFKYWKILFIFYACMIARILLVKPRHGFLAVDAKIKAKIQAVNLNMSQLPNYRFRKLRFSWGNNFGISDSSELKFCSKCLFFCDTYFDLKLSSGESEFTRENLYLLNR